MGWILQGTANATCLASGKNFCCLADEDTINNESNEDVKTLRLIEISCLISFMESYKKLFFYLESLIFSLD